VEQKLMQNTLLVRIAHNYGKRAIYPVNEAAQLIAELAGTKTLTHEAIQTAKRLGYTIKAEEPQL
jgi:hypothetical protein